MNVHIAKTGDSYISDIGRVPELTNAIKKLQDLLKSTVLKPDRFLHGELDLGWKNPEKEDFCRNYFGCVIGEFAEKIIRRTIELMQEELREIVARIEAGKEANHALTMAQEILAEKSEKTHA